VPNISQEDIVSHVVHSNSHEPDVLAWLADDDLEDLCYYPLVELAVVLLVVDDEPTVSVLRLLNDPCLEVAAFWLSGEVPDSLVGWHGPSFLEVVADPVVH
jgi:hypothetical protein